MKKISLCILNIALFLLVLSCGEKRKNKNSYIETGVLWLDNNGVHINAHGGGIMHFGEKYYWYGEHKIAGEAGNKAQVGVHCYSSENLYEWKDEGIALSVIENDSTHDIAKGCILERPKVVYNKKTKKFVMWFHLELLNTVYASAKSGVAVADNPTGPFTFVKSVRPNAENWPVNVQELHKTPVPSRTKPNYCGGPECMAEHPDSLNILGRDFKKGQMARDMTLFVDDDEKAYHIYSSEDNSTLHISLLTDDYLSHAGVYHRFFTGRFMEAPILFKRKGNYYLIASGCTGWRPNEARSAVANSIFGPWKELGNPCAGVNAALTFNGQGTYVLPVKGKDDAFIFMADRWQPKDAIDGRYLWLPIDFSNNQLQINWKDKWDFDYFDK